jgi:polysaccharide deacetylase 2 family uncharacterized protein YibQ
VNKSPFDKEIEKPLGLDRRSARPERRRWSFSIGQFALSLAAVVIVVAAGAISLQEKPFRSPAQVVITMPTQEVAESAPPSRPQAAYPPAAGATGPSIIRVNPPVDTASGNGGSIIVRDPSALGHDPHTAHLPDRELIEETEIGMLPLRARDGRRPFDVYARAWSNARGARVAIIIGGLGVSQSGTQAALSRLPPEVTLAFASGGNSLDRWSQAARRQGHEILMQVPLEPFDYPEVDPGRNTLTVDADPIENRDRLYWALSRITNYTGILNYMGARFVTEEAAMSPFFGELGKRGLMFVDDGSSARSLAPATAERQRVPYAASDIVIDAERERGAIIAKLDDLERTARARGFAVGIGSAFDVTVDAVATWVQEAARRGIEIVPVSAVANDPERG